MSLSFLNYYLCSIMWVYSVGSVGVAFLNILMVEVYKGFTREWGMSKRGNQI